MSSTNVIGYEPDGQAVDQCEFDEDGFEVVDEQAERARNLRPTVEMEIQAKVDANHPDAKHYGLTLEAEERLEAREWEIERTNKRFDRRQDSDREQRTRCVAVEGSKQRRHAFQKRAASVDEWEHPFMVDPREQLLPADLATVNRETRRLAEKLPGWSRAAISRRLAERVVEQEDVMSAVVGVYEELQAAPGRVVPIEAVGDVQDNEVTIEGRVSQLWEPSNRKIGQVGLLEDETGRLKFTVWKASMQPRVQEGERVIIRAASKSWYQGRVSVAVTGRSSISFPEREQWWTE